MVKAIFFDVDGTLLSHESKDVPVSARKALEELKQKGIHVVAATGRHILEMADLPVNDISFDSYITLNGQLCLNQNKDLVFGNPLENEEKEAIIQLFNEKEIPVMMIEKDRIYMNFVNDYVRKAQADVSTCVFDCDEYTGNDIYMVSVYIDSSREDEFRKKFSNCLVTRWHDLGIDIVSKTGGKVAGIKRYLEMYNIDIKDTMAFGDGENDLEMLKFVNLGVAMGNGKDIVKQEADYVTSDIDDDGVYNALKALKVL